MNGSSCRHLAALSLSLAAAAPSLAQDQGVQIAGSLGLGGTHIRNQTGGSSLVAVQDNLLNASWLRVSGSEDLSRGWTALFRLEAGLGVDSGAVGGAGSGGAKFWNRQSWVGLRSGSLGQLTVGRQFHAAADRAIRSFDVYNLAGSSIHVAPFALFGVNRYSGNDTRADNSVKYRMSVPGLLELGVSTGLGEGTPGRSHSADVAWVRKDFELGVAYVRYNAPATVAATGALPRHRVLSLGGNATMGSVRAYFSYAESSLDPTQAGRQAQKNKLSSLGLNWSLAPRLAVKVAYYGDEGKHLNGLADRNGTKRTWVASSHYELSSRTELSAVVFRNRFADGYMLEPVNLAALGRDATQSGVGGVSLGIRHAF